MKVTGIIAEYNPFHKGHKYQIDTLRRAQNTDYIIAVMSGDFVQRGAPALADKYSRTQMALLGGVDLVLELPALYATASAELFAKGGIQTLAATGLVDSVCFGMEQADSSTLEHLSRLLLDEPDWYRAKLQEGLKSGLSFPAARAYALPEYKDFLSSPNNILALEYARAVQSYAPDLTLLPIKRRGSGYHDSDLSGELSSASAIRASLQESTACPGQLPKGLASALPETSFRVLSSYYKETDFLWPDDFSLLLHHCLLSQTWETLTSYLDITPALANRILTMSREFVSFSHFCEAVKTRDLTYARVSRALTHLILGITQELSHACPQVPYLRVLGFRKSAAPLLGQLHKKAQVPVVTSLAQAVNQEDAGVLSPAGRKMLDTDIYAWDLYRAVLTTKTGRCYPGEFQRRLLVVE